MPSSQIITEADILRVIKRGPEVGVTQAIRETGKSPGSVFKQLKLRGISIVRLPCSYRVDATAFQSVTTAGVAYILGLLWADGHLPRKHNQIGIEMDTKDLLVVKPLFDHLGQWSYNQRTRKGRSHTISALYTSNPLIATLLKSLDYCDKSTAAPTKVLAHIPATLHRFFWRGFIDGDGCFYKHGHTCQLILAGSYSQDWTAHERWLTDMGVRFKVKRRLSPKGNSSIVRVTSLVDITHLIHWLYEGFENDGIGLPRKYAKAQEIAQQCRQRPTNQIGYRGVSRSQTQGKVVAAFIRKGMYIHIGTFADPVEAAKAYDRKAVEILGHRAKTNFPLSTYLNPMP